MKLIRHGDPGRESPGVILEDGSVVDASSEFRDFDEGFFAFGGLESLRSWINDGCPGGSLVDADVRRGAPVARHRN
jgi:2,4-diketo-3-deoxy-L-fuconate hydrolase